MKVNSSNRSHRSELLASQGSQRHTQLRIIPWEMGKPKGSTILTLGSLLCALSLAAKQHWVQQIQTLTFAYSTTPFYLMYGQVPRLVVDMVVHHNLMLDVSFLPILEPASEELEADASDVVSECEHLPIDAISGLAVEASADSTRSWISGTPDANSQFEEDAVDLEMEDELHSSSGASDQLTRALSARGMPSPSVLPNPLLTDIDPDPVDATD